MTDQVPADHADVLVVGGGSAGSALAGCLARDPQRSVLLVESGPSTQDPALARELADGASLLAAYDPRVSSGLDVDLDGARRAELRRGRVLGGSSAVNGAYFVRARPEDLDRWSAAGNPGWGFDEVLPSFERMEHDIDLGARPGHGRRGPVPVRRELVRSGVTDAFFSACAAEGYVELDDLNAPSSTPSGAFGIVPRNVDADGRRVDVAAAYLTAPERPNLRVLVGCTAARVVVRSGRAVGVELRRDGDEHLTTLTADEVVLSAGAVGSAELLVRSGVGPVALLASQGRTVVHDAPGLGTATFDHPCIDLMYLPVEGVLAPHSSSFMQGALHLDEGIEVMATRVPYGVVTGHDPSDPLLSLRVTLTLPTARGRLRWGDDLDDGVAGVEQRALSTSADRALARAGVRAAARLAARPMFQALVARWHGPRREELRSDAQLDEWIRRHLATAFHLAGTAPMGPVASPDAVVGPDLRVHGVDGLRVVDASVMPMPLSRGPAATACMIGEHAASIFGPA